MGRIQIGESSEFEVETSMIQASVNLSNSKRAFSALCRELRGAQRCEIYANRAKVFLIIIAITSACALAVADPFVDSVVSVTFGAAADPAFADPQRVLGPPEAFDALGLGGSTDVLNLGLGGSVTVQFVDNVIYNGPGPDFTVFENPFYIGGSFEQVYLEPGYVEVSDDGVHFVQFPCDYVVQSPPLQDDPHPSHYLGFAGVHPVFSNSANGISPLDPAVSGGDTFDLADIAAEASAQGIDLDNIRFIRITDVYIKQGKDSQGDIIPGTNYPTPNGFDLDAISALHSRPVEQPTAASARLWGLYQ
jgi:hypothetical protein